MKIRIGLGYDIHALKEGRTLFLGGVGIPFSKGLLGHSDGDCLIHAIVDALLGAMGEKDIGQLFPDSDPAYKNIRSTRLLEAVIGRLIEKKMVINNVDSVIICQEPRLADHVLRMKEVLCPILQIRPDSLGIKPRTNEGLGAIGQGDAVAALATVLIQSES
ncbi:MAG: 2-C-methyl-D-erythritol 2,4-cyclodiphosphate synthase [Candidatus Aminicenantes bacterium]|nr:2-C-methyl-D-erythritol 2,4-cyclodiphosphate synthase [Candidatus Aminicenantes bacterium]